MSNGLLSLPAAAGEWSELGNRDIDHRARGVRVKAREAIESNLSELRSDPRFRPVPHPLQLAGAQTIATAPD
jgi:hypothetical protein